MDESNLNFRNKDVSSYPIDIIMGMIHGYVDNDLCVGDYMIINNRYYRFAEFYQNKMAVLLPDRIIGNSKNSFSDTINLRKKPYINTYKIPEILNKFGLYNILPILQARLMTEDDIDRLHLFKYNKSFLRECFGNAYFLQDLYDRKSFKCIDTNGELSAVPAQTNLGIRPIIIIGYPVIKVLNQ